MTRMAGMIQTTLTTRATRTTRALALAPLFGLALAPALGAQVEIERRRPAPARAEVSIENAFGSVKVRAWSQNEVLVRGLLAAGAEGLSFDGDKEGTQISVEVPDAWFHAPGEDAAFRSSLEVFAPAGSTLEIDTVNATIQVEGFSGDVEAETVNGTVRILGPAASVEVETMTGSVEVRASAAPMDIRSISGAVVAHGATREVKVETVSGSVEVAGTAVAEMEIRTTTGAVLFDGSLARRGGIEIETFSSPVRLILPKTVRTVFDLQTFAGKIASDFCAGTPVTRERFAPFRQLRCSTGAHSEEDEFEIHVRTHDADITISAK